MMPGRNSRPAIRGPPGGGAAYPGGGVAYPEEGAGYPGGGAAYPGGGAAYPGGGAVWPGGGIGAGGGPCSGGGVDPGATHGPSLITRPLIDHGSTLTDGVGRRGEVAFDVRGPGRTCAERRLASDDLGLGPHQGQAAAHEHQRGLSALLEVARQASHERHGRPVVHAPRAVQHPALAQAVDHLRREDALRDDQVGRRRGDLVVTDSPARRDVV